MLRIWLIFLLSQTLWASSLTPIKTDSPRDTMRSFMEAMQDYKDGLETSDHRKLSRIHDAVRTLDLSEVPFVLRESTGNETAIFLKEVIDRVILIDYEKIPTDDKLPRWRLKDTEITIYLVSSGERNGEHLFSPDTVSRASSFFQKVKQQPYLKGSGKGAGYKEPWIQRKVPHYLKRNVFGFKIWQVLGLLLLIFVGLLVKKAVQLLVDLLHYFTSKTSSQWDDKVLTAVDKPIGLVAATGFWYACLRLLEFQGHALEILTVILQIVLSIALIWMAYRLTTILSGYLKHIASKTRIELDDQVYPLLTKALKLFVLVLGTLIAAQNLGINVSSLIAGLGLGGLAFALAAQDTVSNLFGSIMILWDQPFRVGDWVKTTNAEGTVEEIGFRSTRVRTFYDSQISIPNRELANAHIDNMGRRTFRRILTNLGVTYNTPAEKLEAFMEGIRQIINAHPQTRKDYFHVVFSGYGNSSLDIMLYFFVEVPDWSEELIARQNIFLNILKLAEEMNVQFAYPSQSLYLESTPENPQAQQPLSEPQELLRMAKKFGPGGSASKPHGLGIFTPPHTDVYRTEQRGSEGE